MIQERPREIPRDKMLLPSPQASGDCFYKRCSLEGHDTVACLYKEDFESKPERAHRCQRCPVIVTDSRGAFELLEQLHLGGGLTLPGRR